MVSTQTPKQKVRTSAEMFPLIEEWESSGLPQKEFCIDRRIKPHIFWYWLRQYRDSKQHPGKEAGGFIPVEVEGPATPAVLAEIIYPDGTRLVFKERVSLAVLRELVSKD